MADRLAVGDLARRAEVDELRLYRSIRPEVEVGRSDAAPVRHDDGALDAVFELADVTRPGIAVDRSERVRCEGLNAWVELAAEAVDEMPREQDRVARAFGERGDFHHDLGEPVIEILAEAALGDHRVEVLVRRADDARVDRDRLAAADALDHALLEEAQQLDLERQRNVADLVEEKRAGLRQLDLADVRFDRASEGAALVPEQLRFEQVLRDRRAIDGDELALAAARLVHSAREQLLARAARAQQHDGNVG